MVPLILCTWKYLFLLFVCTSMSIAYFDSKLILSMENVFLYSCTKPRNFYSWYLYSCVLRNTCIYFLCVHKCRAPLSTLNSCFPRKMYFCTLASKPVISFIISLILCTWKYLYLLFVCTSMSRAFIDSKLILSTENVFLYFCTKTRNFHSWYL